MNNPFDKEKEYRESVFFDKVTNAIDHWLSVKFPEFNLSILDKMQKLEFEHKRITSIINEYSTLKHEYRKEITEEIIKEVNDFLMKEYPDLDKSLKMTAKNVENKQKKLEDRIKTTELLQSKSKINDSICEDVYKMRDEFKEIKKFLDEFKTQVKKAFQIKDNS